MKNSNAMMVSAALMAMLSLAPLAQAQTATQAAATAKGKVATASTTVTATVTQIDQKTRQITLKAQDGREVSFVASDEVKNFAQMKVGDVVTATYTEALAYEVKKGGTAGASQTIAGGTAKAGAKPAAALGQQTTVTVTITAIDPAAPSVTFRGPAGNTRTVKVLHPERLKDVSVGDTVEITYTEAIAIKVESAKK